MKTCTTALKTMLPIGLKTTLTALLLAASLLGQDTRPDVADLAARLDVLQREIAARAAHEKQLEDRVADLQRAVAARPTIDPARLEALEEMASGRIQAVDEAVARIEHLGRVERDTSALSVGGYFDFEFRDDHAEEHDTFDQHRFILKFDADVLDDTITFKSEVEIEGGGTADYLTDSEVAVEFAELHFHFDRALNLKVGALLVPFGRLNYRHDSFLQELTDRPLVDTFIVPTTWTESGVGLYGAVDAGGVVFDYDVLVSNGLDQDFDATAGGGLRDARGSFREDNNDGKMLIGRVGITPEVGFLDALNVGVSGATGNYDDRNQNRLSLWGVDLTARRGPFELLFEYTSANLERDASLAAAGVPGGASGLYAQLGFHFFPESWRGATPFFTQSSTFTLVFRYDTVDTDDSARAIDRIARGDEFRDDVQRFTFGLNFRPIEKTVVKIEYQWFAEPSGIDDADNDRIVLSFATAF